MGNEPCTTSGLPERIAIPDMSPLMARARSAPLTVRPMKPTTPVSMRAPNARKIPRKTKTWVMATTIALPRRPITMAVRVTGDTSRRSKNPCSMSVARSPADDVAANNTPCTIAPAAV